MEKFIDAKFKDSSPVATVERIKSILASYGIEVEEEWRETSVPYCYASSAKVVGTTFGAHGKGLSEDFARASCYGELMERLQIGYLYTPGVQKEGASSFAQSQDKLETMEQILQENGDWYQKMADRFHHLTGKTTTPQQFLSQFTGKDGTLKVTPYYCLTKQKAVSFPNALKTRMYTTNGCAAGNSPEETMVQAISECVERNYMVQINHNCITLPDIPDEVLQKFETAYQIIQHIRGEGYKVVVKDCSLGKKFPVICVYIIDKATGRYHTHYGAYPIFEIALERALTESFQGRNIRNIAQYEDFLYKKPGEFSFASLSNEFIHGTHEKTTSFFMSPPAHPFNENVGFNGSDSKALLGECIEFFREQGYDILVRDQSCLGFCTYQVIIPGYSEPFIQRLDMKLDEYRYAYSALKVLRNPSAASMPDMLGFLMHLDEMGKYTSNIFGVHGFFDNSKLAVTAPGSTDKLLMLAARGYVYYTLGKLQQVVDCVAGMIPLTSKEEKEYLICLKRYLSLKLNGYSPEDIWQILDYLHNPVTVGLLYSTLDLKENPLGRFTLHCDEKHCEGCRLEAYCCQKRVLELAEILQEKTLQLDFDAFCADMDRLVKEVI